MSGAAFTPGKWKQTPDGYRVFEMHGRLAHEIVCWTAGNNKQRTQRARDNAKLIAAAPDMFEALQKHVALIELWRETGVPPIRKMLIQLEKTQAILAKVQS